MIDVRNAIVNIVDRYTLADIVEITLRKMRRNKIPLPFVVETMSGSDGRRRVPSRPLKKAIKGASVA